MENERCGAEIRVAGNDRPVFKINVIIEQEITLRDVANYLDNIGIQFLATIGSAMLRGWRIEMSLQTPYILSFKA